MCDLHSEIIELMECCFFHYASYTRFEKKNVFISSAVSNIVGHRHDCVTVVLSFLLIAYDISMIWVKYLCASCCSYQDYISLHICNLGCVSYICYTFLCIPICVTPCSCRLGMINIIDCLSLLKVSLLEMVLFNCHSLTAWFALFYFEQS